MVTNNINIQSNDSYKRKQNCMITSLSTGMVDFLLIFTANIKFIVGKRHVLSCLINCYMYCPNLVFIFFIFIKLC